MTSAISLENRQEWITAYKEAHKQLDRAQCKLSALINLIQGNGIDDSLKMDPSEREGLRNLLEDIADQIAAALYEDLPFNAQGIARFLSVAIDSISNSRRELTDSEKSGFCLCVAALKQNICGAHEADLMIRQTEAANA